MFSVKLLLRLVLRMSTAPLPIVVGKKPLMSGCVIGCRKVRLIIGEVSGHLWNSEEGTDG